MIREQLYRETLDIVYRAYFNGHLLHGDCHACVVGNIVAARHGYEISIIDVPHRYFDGSTTSYTSMWLKDGSPTNWPVWAEYCRTRSDGVQTINEEKLKRVWVRAQIESTGYTPQEIAMIEFAFESARIPTFGAEENMFRGLEAVLNVLAVIHQADDNQPEVSRFREHYKTLVHH